MRDQGSRIPERPPQTRSVLVVEVLLLDLALEGVVVALLSGLLLLHGAARGLAEAAGSDGERDARDELLEIRASARRAHGILRGTHERLELGAARTAAEIVERHGGDDSAAASVEANERSE